MTYPLEKVKSSGTFIPVILGETLWTSGPSEEAVDHVGERDVPLEDAFRVEVRDTSSRNVCAGDSCDVHESPRIRFSSVPVPDSGCLEPDPMLI